MVSYLRSIFGPLAIQPINDSSLKNISQRVVTSVHMLELTAGQLLRQLLIHCEFEHLALAVLDDLQRQQQ